MRREELRQIRLANLRRLAKRMTFAQIERRSGVSAAWLSQVNRETVQARGVSPRALGDDACRRIEQGLGLAPGWFDRPPEVHSGGRWTGLTQDRRLDPAEAVIFERWASALRAGRISVEQFDLLTKAFLGEA